MRSRHEHLATGHLFTVADTAAPLQNQSLLLLVEGARDIEVLERVVRLCDEHPSTPVPRPVADQADLRSVNAEADPARVVRIEARELEGLTDVGARSVLHPALDRLASGHLHLFPAAGSAVGGVARGLEFLDREDDVAAVRRSLAQGHDLEILAPRRSGKSSLLDRIQEALAEEYVFHHVDMQRHGSVDDFVARAWATFLGRRPRDGRREVADRGWQATLDDALECVGHSGEPAGGPAGGSSVGRQAVLLLDEAVLLLQELARGRRDPADGIELLARIRGGGTRWGYRLVLAGSVGLSSYLARFRAADASDTRLDDLRLDELHPHALAPLSEGAEATDLRRVLIGSGLVAEDGDLAWLRGNVDLGAPFPALRFLDHLAGRVRHGDRLDTSELETELVSFLDRTDAFRSFEDHLQRDVDPSDVDSVERTLDDLARASLDAGLLEADVRARVPEHCIAPLLQACPSRVVDGRVTCASRLWRRWWRRQAGIET